MSVKIMYDNLKSKKGVIYIDETYTDGAIMELKRCIDSGIVKPSKINDAHILYDCTKGIDFNESAAAHYPLKLTGPDITVYVTAVTAGYGGEGPHGMLKCLEMTGFKLSEKQKNSVLTKPRLPNGEENPLIILNFSK